MLGQEGGDRLEEKCIKRWRLSLKAQGRWGEDNTAIVLEWQDAMADTEHWIFKVKRFWEMSSSGVEYWHEEVKGLVKLACWVGFYHIPWASAEWQY